ncbi:MAG TPA: hypothetical protein VET30_00220 [Pseudoxanthomonas sp.]|nr:hypothetical protein [Pseudoxanthomonas sp.]
MRILFSLVSFLFTLMGCHPRPGVATTMTFSSVDGIGINSTKARIGVDDARFECLQSATGHCHFVVFVSDCKQPAANVGTAGCSTRVVERFILDTGGVREMKGLPTGVRHCLGHDAMPVAPECGKG